jgi:hypothetical protein
MFQDLNAHPVTMTLALFATPEKNTTEALFSNIYLAKGKNLNIK